MALSLAPDPTQLPVSPFGSTNPLQDTSIPPEEVPLSPEDQKEYDDLFKFSQAKTFLQELKQSFSPELVISKANRERRKIDVDIDQERTDGRIKQSDVLVPMRVIDEAIGREKPGLVGYLQQSRRLAVFVDVQEPDNKHDALEAAFTRGMQYQNWITSHYQVIDGAQLHGWDWYEVLYDNTKPLHCGIESVGHDRLYFPIDTEDIQNCIRVMREYKLSKTQLREFVTKYGFEDAQVKKVLASQGQNGASTGTAKDKTYSIFKLYFKYRDPKEENNVVYVAWFAFDTCDDWLKAPSKFYNGVDQLVTVMVPKPPTIVIQPHHITGEPTPVQVPQPPQQSQEWQPVDETLYPLVPLFYEETEQKDIQSKKGRAFKDKFKQEVMTVGWSSFLNGHNRATWIIPYKDEQDGKPTSEFESIEIADGKAVPFKVGFLKMPYPDPALLQGLQAFDSKIATSSGQMTYAIQTKSSGARTTAREVDSAENTQNLLTSVNITLFAAACRMVWDKAWKVVQSQALQDKIDFYGQMTEVPPPSPDFDTQYVFKNDTQTISRKFDIRPAGDVDVIQRQQLIQKMMQYWAIVENTPIAMAFLAYLLKLEFAEQGEVWANQLQAGDPFALLVQLFQVMQGIISNPDELKTLPPQGQQNLQMLMQACQQMIASRQQMQNSQGQQTKPQQGNTNGNTTANVSGGQGTRAVTGTGSQTGNAAMGNSATNQEGSGTST